MPPSTPKPDKDDIDCAWLRHTAKPRDNLPAPAVALEQAAPGAIFQAGNELL
jgi:hypothetical protein